MRNPVHSSLSTGVQRLQGGVSLFLLVVLGTFAPAGFLQAQQDTPVEARKGRLITSMGQPSPWGYFVAGDVGLAPVDTREFNGQFSLGFERSLLNPLLSILSVTGEYFMGIRGNAGGQVGFRGGLEVPVLRLGAGWQYDFRASDDRPYVTLRHPLRRGGVFWPGGQARILWAPGKDQSLTLGVTVPLARPFAGRTRPRTVKARIPLPVSGVPPSSSHLSDGVEATLASATGSALRLARLYVPHLGSPTESAYRSDGDVARAMRALAMDLDMSEEMLPASGGSVNVPEATVRRYHRQLESAFREVSAETGIPEPALAAATRRALLDEVIFPYNRFLGQKKAGDTFDQLAARARVAFARELVLIRGLDRHRIEVAEAVFNAILEIVREVEGRQVGMWGDDRMAFLPPQLALLPEDHDSQSEIDDLLSRAVDVPFTEGNRAWFVVNEDFEYELLRMIQETRRYHVLWIHDIRGNDDFGDPDEVAFRTVLDGYLDALADRVEAYDQEGALPVYMILIDQFFYQGNNERLFLSLLEDPLNYELDLPEGFEAWEEEIGNAQDRLRRAVANSRLLQAEAREYGEEWLQNRIRVQVSVTNPADPTFWAWDLIPWTGFPDALIRDHRKIAFFDLDPLDPYQGRALYTGMGVGEHYNGPTWDDRALLVQGPVLRFLRVAARDLLLQQGFDPIDIPYPLQDEGDLPLWPNRPAGESGPDGSSKGRMLQAHNWIGYGQKKATVLKATLYVLMPSGAVVKSPDSLWNFSLWASLLTGHALRGGRVMAVAPTARNAPGTAFGSMALAENVLGQMALAAKELAPAIRQVGGVLKVGMYAPTVGVGDIPGKARTIAASYRAHPWLAELHGAEDEDLIGLEALADSLDAAGFRARYLEGEALEAPKLHMKVHFFSTQDGWDPLMAQPEADEFLAAYLRERAIQVSDVGRDRDLRMLQENLSPFRDRLKEAWRENTTPDQRDLAAWFLTVGSHNQNFRSAALDGEVLVTLAGEEALIGLADQMLILGLCEWIDEPEELRDHFLPLSGLMRGLGLWARFVF